MFQDYYEKVKAALAWDAVSITISALTNVSDSKITVTSKKLRNLILTVSFFFLKKHVIFQKVCIFKIEYSLYT